MKILSIGPFSRFGFVTGVLALSLAGPAPALDAKHAASGKSLGAVDFDVSCAEAVRADFDHAVALLHHMMYAESRQAFEQIAEADPDCAMAHWGIATSLFQPLWPTRPGPEHLKRGFEEVEKAKALGPGSEREGALVAAAAAFFREPETADWWTRIRRWADAMEVAYEQSPEQVETAAFYALSRLAVAQVEEDRMIYHAEAAKVLLDIYDQRPTHPGAVHYTIHANDTAARAGEALDVVRSYSKIAPSVPHALHMPTHIFVRLGDWPATIEWNRKSAAAALRFPHGDAVSHHYPHAMDYLLYARLQQGEDQRAKALLDETLMKENYQDSFVSGFHLAAMPARYAVERRDWVEAAKLEPRMPGTLSWDRYPWAEALSWCARGLGAAHGGDLDAARAAERRMEALRDAAKAAGEAGFARYIEIDRRILAARIAHQQGESGEAVALLRATAKLDRTIEKHPITPGALLPPYEALGDLLMELERPAEALEAFQSSLEIWPGRYNSLLGAARAARAAGRDDVARSSYSALLEVAGEVEAPRTGVTEAREFVAREM